MIKGTGKGKDKGKGKGKGKDIDKKILDMPIEEMESEHINYLIFQFVKHNGLNLRIFKLNLNKYLAVIGLEESGGVVTEAAKMIGVHRSFINRLMGEIIKDKTYKVQGYRYWATKGINNPYFPYNSEEKQALNIGSNYLGKRGRK